MHLVETETLLPLVLMLRWRSLALFFLLGFRFGFGGVFFQQSALAGLDFFFENRVDLVVV